jgi:acetyl-CoA carboxylase alpha subunit
MRLIDQLDQLDRFTEDQLIAARYQRLLSYGEYLEK